MVGNTGTLMTMRIVRSKLRKRDESSATTATTVTIESPQHGHHNRSNRSSDNNHYRENQDQQIFSTTTISDGNDNNNSTSNCMELEAITFARTSGGCNTSNAWVFPPKAPSPNIYNCANHVSKIVNLNHSYLYYLCNLLVFKQKLQLINAAKYSFTVYMYKHSKNLLTFLITKKKKDKRNTNTHININTQVCMYVHFII